MQHFFVLNVLWAASIVLLEVPSGAFADTFGRANLVRLAGVCMVVEMAIIAFVPLGDAWLLLAAFALNRVISGAAEALASGADEALAYDTLKQLGREKEWSNALDLLMRIQSGGFLAAMLIGAAVYDELFLNGALTLVGLRGNLTGEATMRFPLYLTLLTSGIALYSAFKLTEPPEVGQEDEAPAPKSPGAAFALVAKTGRWILSTKVVLTLIVAAVCFDSLVRVGLTINSEYYRLIGLPEAALGIMGAVGGLMGLFIPIVARKLVVNKSPVFNFSLLAVVILISLIGQALLIPFWGVVPAMGIGVSMFMLNFFISNYLNEAVTDSRRRATVLSFRSLACNIAYGFAGLVFFGLTLGLKGGAQATDMSSDGDAIFAHLLRAMPVLFIFLMLFLAWFTHFHRPNDNQKST
ncbi:MAG: MFS transporter [Puniceicoccales bacterium]